MNEAAFLAGLGAAIALTPLIRILARDMGFVDNPRPDRHHQTPTPYLGGIAVFLAMLIGVAVSGGLKPAAAMGHSKDVLVLLVGAAALLLGLADDWRGLSPPLKFAGQVGIATVFLSVSGPGPTHVPGWDGILGLLWMVGFMNAFNFLDNMDGVLSGVAFIAALALAGLMILHGVAGVGSLLALAGALLGFLLYNLPPARIFLGDAGSLSLGAMLPAAGWLFASETGTLAAWMTLPLVLSYPLFDTTFVTLTRLKRGQRPWVGGRDHTTHRLGSLLGGPRRTLLVVYGLAVLGCLGALLGGVLREIIWLLPYWWVGLVYLGLGLKLATVRVR